MPEQRRSRCKAADECNIFCSFQQVAGRIFGEMHEQVGRGESRFEGTGSGYRRALGTPISMRDGSKVGPSKFLAIDVASQEILDTGTISSRRGTEDAGDRAGCVRGFPPSCGKRVLVSWLLACCDRAYGRIDERDLGGEQVAEQTRNSPGHIDPGPTGACRRQNLYSVDAAGRSIPRRTAPH